MTGTISYFLYCEGMTPYISLKYFEKYLGLLNPTLYATSLIVN